MCAKKLMSTAALLALSEQAAAHAGSHSQWLGWEQMIHLLSSPDHAVMVVTIIVALAAATIWGMVYGR